MTRNSRAADFGLLMNFTGMITVVFAVPCAGFSFSSLGPQAGLLKSRKNNFFNNFYAVLVVFAQD